MGCVVLNCLYLRDEGISGFLLVYECFDNFEGFEGFEGFEV